MSEPGMTRPWQIFLSHAREDDWIADQIAAHLRRMRVRSGPDVLRLTPWQANQAEERGPWRSAVERALRSSRALVAVVTPAGVASGHVFDEVAQALELELHIRLLVSNLPEGGLPIPWTEHFWLPLNDFHVYRQIIRKYARNNP